MAIGPVLGGFVLSSFDASFWRVIFAINLPLGALAVYLLVAKVPADLPDGQRRLDLVGAAIAIAGARRARLRADGAKSSDSMGNFELRHGAFHRGRHRAVASVFLLLGGAPARTDGRTHRCFASGAFSAPMSATFFLYFALGWPSFYLPMLLICRLGADLLPKLVSSSCHCRRRLPFSPVRSANLSDQSGHACRLQRAARSSRFCLGWTGHPASAFHGFWSAVFPAMALMGLGMALVVSPLSTAIMTAVDDRHSGAASGINNAVARMAGLFAVAAMGGVAAFRYEAVLDGTAGVPGFGEPVAELPAALDASPFRQRCRLCGDRVVDGGAVRPFRNHSLGHDPKRRGQEGSDERQAAVRPAPESGDSQDQPLTAATFSPSLSSCLRRSSMRLRS